MTPSTENNPPAVRFVATLEVRVGEIITVGDGPHGQRRFVPILGGTVAGPRLTGEIVPAGEDVQVVRHDGVIALEARYLLQLDDGALVFVNNRGLRFARPADAPDASEGDSVYFRSVPTFETATSGPHSWLHRTMFIGIGERHPDKVHLRVFEF